jgi:hypothetical protein
VSAFKRTADVSPSHKEVRLGPRCRRFALPILGFSNEWDAQEWDGAVNRKQRKHLFATCQCGKVKFEAVGPRF